VGGHRERLYGHFTDSVSTVVSICPSARQDVSIFTVVSIVGTSDRSYYSVLNLYNADYIPKYDQRFQRFQQEICGLFTQHALVTGPCTPPDRSMLSQWATLGCFGSRKRDVTKEDDVSWAILKEKSEPRGDSIEDS